MNKLSELLPTVTELLDISDVATLFLSPDVAFAISPVRNSPVPLDAIRWLKISYGQVTPHVIANDEVGEILETIRIQVEQIEPLFFSDEKEKGDWVEQVLFQELIWAFQPGRIWEITNSLFAYTFDVTTSDSHSVSALCIVDIRQIVTQLETLIDEDHTISLDIDLSKTRSEFTPRYLSLVCRHLREVLLARLDTSLEYEHHRLIVISNLQEFPDPRPLFSGIKGQITHQF
ncbi:hypothetical protein QVA66_06165 [Staphylococcus chromogenes]|nr:hypothetical protein [Staphylococcus chromogenes]